MPVLWSLRNAEDSKSRLSNTYKGFFQFGHSAFSPEVCDLQRALYFDKPNFEKLKKQIDPTLFSHVWFNETLLSFIEHSGRQMEQLGTFGFTLSNP